MYTVDRRWQGRKTGALGEVVQQKALPVKLVGRGNRPGLLQQLQRRGLRLAAGLDHGFVFRGVFVRPEQNFVELLANGLRALAADQLGRPGIHLCLQLLFLLDRGQRLLQDFCRRFLKPPFARAAKVMRRTKQRHQHAGLLDQAGVGREVVLGNLGKAKLGLGGKFPGQVQLHLGRLRLGLGQQLRRAGLVKLQKDVGGFDLDPFARVQLDLGGGIGLGKDAAGEKFSGIFKQCVHGGGLSHGGRVLPPFFSCRFASSGQFQKT